MKIYSKLALILGFAMAFAACSDDDNFNAGTWDGTSENSDNVYFATDSVVLNDILDPTDATIKTFTVHRLDTAVARTVEFEILENTDSMFQISPASFAKGETDATFTVDFSKAQPDIDYKLRIQPKGASSWSTNAVLSYSLLIEKWNDLGVGLYTDDLVGGIFGADPISYEINILEKASKPGLIRLVNPYGEAYPYNDEGDWDDSQDYLIEVDASNPAAVTFATQALGLDWGYGMFWAKSVAAGTLEDGIITFPEKGFYVLMEGYKDGAWSFYGNSNGAFQIILPGKYATMQE